MLTENIKNLVNSIFQTSKIPFKITDLFLYRPVFHEAPFEDFEPINEAERLASCNPVYMDLDFELEGRKYSYHVRCTNETKKFSLREYWCKSADLFAGENPQELETKMKKIVESFFAVLLRILEVVC